MVNPPELDKYYDRQLTLDRGKCTDRNSPAPWQKNTISTCNDVRYPQGTPSMRCRGISSTLPMHTTRGLVENPLSPRDSNARQINGITSEEETSTPGLKICTTHVELTPNPTGVISNFVYYSVSRKKKSNIPTLDVKYALSLFISSGRRVDMINSACSVARVCCDENVEDSPSNVGL